ncbi:type II toxin-antitoxin system RelE family toxin [Longimicrobium sp.]|uniref:type II toxin-antitoxin system RelE family toxin n=1 Tax=Longimicrobium sp. TaxID=2029185 RepID=UPI003BEF2627
MKSRTTRQFRERLAELPLEIQERARKAYALFQENPSHRSLQFKPVHPRRPIWSARVTRDYRVLGIRDGDAIVWFWIGPHAEYDRMIAQG